MIDKPNKIGRLVITGAILAAIVSCFVSGCSSLILDERDRALDEDFAKGKINKVQYLSAKNDLQKEQAKLTAK